MFRIVESLSKDPVRFPVKPKVRLVSGNIVSLVEYNGNLVLDLCSGNRPFGMVGKRCWGGVVLDVTKKADIYLQRMIAQTSKFNKFEEMTPGDSLYCSEKGILSTKKPFENSLILGKLISPANDKRKYIEILWL